MIYIGYSKEDEKKERKYDEFIKNAKEEWKQVIVKGVHYPYEVSNKGRVRNSYNGNILKNHEAGGGYLQSEIHLNGRYFKISVHKLVALMFIPIPTDYLLQGFNSDTLQVNHKDGKKHHNAVYNLEWCTGQENIDHSWNTGLRENCYGENFTSSKITEKEAHAICKLISMGFSSTQISKRLGVSFDAVRNIRSGKTWTRVSKNYKFKRSMDSVPFKIDDETFHKICKDIEDCELKNKEIGEKYGISPTYIPLIRNGNIRPEISSQYDFKKNMKKRMSKKDNDELIHMICASLQHGMKPTEIQKKYPDFKLSLSFISEIKNGKLRRNISIIYILIIL